MKTTKNIFLFFMITILFLGFFPLNSYSQFADINYEFQKDTLYTNEGINNQFDDSFNLRNQTYMDLGNYEATYSFTDDGTFSAEGWTFGQDGGRVIVNSEIQEHKKVLDLLDDTDGEIVNTFTMFADQNGILTVEFWWMTNSTPDYNWISFRDDGSHIGFFAITSSTFRTYDGSSWQDTEITATEDVWFHHSITMDTSTELLNWSINSIQYITDSDFWNSITDGIDEMHISTDSTAKDYRVFIDAIGFSWDLAGEVLDFSEDIVGNEPIGWLSDNSGGASTLIKASLDGKPKILEIYDNGFASIPKIHTNFTYSANTSIQFEFATNNTNEIEQNLFFTENELIIIQIHVLFDDLYYIKSGFNLIKSNFINNDEFFKVKMELNNELGIFDVYINDILEVNDIPYVNNITEGINRITIEGHDFHPADPDYSGYIDNIYINVIPGYETGDNIFPALIETDYLEVDKYEFAFSDVNTLYTDGYSGNVQGWILFDESPHMFTNIRVDEFNDDDPNDRVIEMFCADDGWTSGIQRNGEIAGEFFRISADFRLASASGFGGSDVIFGIGHDAERIATINMSFASGIPSPEMTLSYEKNTGFFEIRDDLIEGGNYTFELLISFEIETVFFGYFVNDVLIETYVFPTLNTGHEGLDVIALLGTSFGGGNVLLVDSMTLYREGVPITTDFGWSSIDMNKDSWNYEQNNLFFLNASGDFHLGTVVAPIYTVGETMREFEDFQIYNETLQLRNVYDEYVSDIADPMLIMTVRNHDFSLSYINIEGAKMVEGINEYFLVLSHGGVDIDESYFYVDTSNRLQFIHYSDGSGSDFIQANFDINDVGTNQTTIGWISRRDDNAYAYFRVKFESTSNVYELRPFVDSKKVLLASEKTIEVLIVLVSNNGLSEVTGLTTGYIGSISIQYAPDIIISVVTANLITMIIPLMMILIPTIAISEAYGKSLFVPLFLFMTVILGITGTIPIWLFFVSVISLSLFIFTRRKKSMEEVF